MNKTMKMRMLSILLCFVMLVGLVPTSVIPVHALGLIYGGLIEGGETGEEGTEESHCISITNKPGTTFVLEHDYTSDVCDLWKEIDSEGSGELKFDQSFSININDAIEVYNNYLDTEYPNGDREHYKASEDNYNGSIFYVQARVLINDYQYQFSSKASYQYAPYGLDGEYNEGCGEWNISSYYDALSEFLTMSIDGDVLNLSLDATAKEIYAALKAQDEALGNVTINNLELELRVSCEVEYRGSWGSTNYTELSFEAISHTLYDKHIYQSASEYDNLSIVPVTAPLTVNVAPAYEGCYEPVKTEYNWYYEFIKEGYDNEESDQWYGYFERDESKESDVLTETAPSGTVFGVAYGKIDSGDKNYITLNDILNENNKAFINSFIGEKPRELGGKGQMSIVCTVTLTFEDGKQWVVDITKADHMSRLILPCMHACTVCGLCTVTDEMLPCNFDQMSYDITNVCMCEEPSVPEYEITVKSEKTVTIESTERIVKVVVEQVEVEETPPNSFIINATEAVGADNVMAFYNIDVFDEAGYPYTLNQWYDAGEELTVSISVSMEEALALQSGEAVLYHILADGTAEVVEGVTVVIDGESATMTFTSNSFSPFIIARVEGDPIVNGAVVSGEENETFYETLDAALEAATGGTVKLLADATVDTVVLKPGVTLDLNGYTLTADILVAMNGAKMCDGATGGLLKIAKDNLALAKDNGGVIPVWNGADGYIFTCITFQQTTGTAGEGVAQYIFLPAFSNAEAAALLADGGLDNGLKIQVCLSWNDGYSQQFYTYSDDLVKQVFDGTGSLAFDLSVTGIAGIADMVASPVITTDTGAQAATTGTTITAE